MPADQPRPGPGPGRQQAWGPAGTFRPFPEDLPTLTECRQLLMDRVPGPPSHRPTVHLDEALGRVLATDIYSAHDIPTFDRATMDGYAVHSQAIKSAGPEAGVDLQLVDEATAEQVIASLLQPAEAFGVATGAMIPPAADAVVPGEYCQTTGSDRVTISRAFPTGANILHRGSDLKAGQLALPAGTVLKAPQLGILAALGQTEVQVCLRPTVAIIATGDELVPPDRTPGPGQIRDSNTHTLAAALALDGVRVRRAGITADKPGVLPALLKEELQTADMVLISGGSSVGKTDLTRDALAALGAEVLFHGVRLKPGKPTLFGLLGDKVIVGLPGKPVSALVIYYALVRPALRKLMGWSDPLHEITVAARLTAAIRRPAAREELVRVRLYRADGRQWAEPVPGTSGMLHSLAQADGQVLIPLARSGYEAHDVVDVQLFS